VNDLKRCFTPGQTVRAYILDNTGNKISISLKPSQCGPNTSTLFLQTYFKEEEMIANFKPGPKTSMLIEIEY